MTFAILPACGQSSRMGRPKLALPLGDRTVLEHAISALRDAGVGPVLVVVGPHVADLGALAEAAGAAVLRLKRETPDMRSTVEAGLCWLEERLCPGPDDDWLLCPADHPALDPGVIRQLRAKRLEAPAQTIFIPTFEGRRGHPALIAWRHVAGMRGLMPGMGLNMYLRRQATATREVPVASAGVLLDLDTPEDYERLRSSIC